MTINYPNGQSPINHGLKNQKKQVGASKKTASFANRGMSFEEYINQSNDYYRHKGMALVYKKPTPVQIVKVDYPRRSAAVITEAYFSQASTTDYNGVYRGCYLDFEAKETKNKASFPLSNFHEHQLQHMLACQKHGGIAFVLLWFSSLQRCFLLEVAALWPYWEQKETGSKSIPLKEIETHGFEIPLQFAPRIPYLLVVDELIAKEN